MSADRTQVIDGPVFVYRELTHKRSGLPVAGCFAWHHNDEPMCDHEHDRDERHICEDARIEMASVRAAGCVVDRTEPGTET